MLKNIIENFNLNESVEKKFKVPASLSSAKYLILGGNIESELRYKLAKVLSVRLKDEVIERLRSGDLEERYLNYPDIITKVKTEDGEEREVYDSEIDHAVNKIP